MSENKLLNGRYELLERIGAGGMAAVWRARDMRLGRTVAVKMLHEGLLNDEEFLEQFQHEAHAAANLTHPHIVTVHDIGRHDHYAYIVMEHVPGRTLKEIIRAYRAHGKQMPIDEVLDLGIQICVGIEYAHRSGLIHCDIKPQNVLVTADGRVKVADFGIARAMSQATGRRSDMVWGTPQYFAPEQAAGETPTPATDVYSIGIVLFEMLTGQLPFTAESPTAVALKHLQEPPPDIRALNPAVPPQLAQIVHKVLRKEPTGRYRTAGQLGRILTSYRRSALQTTAGQAAVPQPTLEETPPIPLPVRSDNQPSVSPTPPDRPPPKRVSAYTPPEQDWTVIVLGLMALAAVLGLIPLWYWVAQAYGAV